MKTTNLTLVISLLIVSGLPTYTRAASVEFQLLTHPDNVHFLPQHKAEYGVSGDHLLHTIDDISASTYNPDGCFTFNFTNPVGISEPDYPPGYAEGIHSMTGSLTLEINLQSEGTVEITSLAFDGFVAQGKSIAHQRLVEPNDPAADGNHGPIDGIPNSGTYTNSPDANWTFEANFDWYYDTPFAGPGGIDMTFDNYQWTGFIIPVSELTPAGMDTVELYDPLGYFPGTSEDFKSWLLNEVAPQLPPQATLLLFAQAEAHPVWTNPMMGMTTDGLVAETIIAYTTAAFGPNIADLDGDWDVDLSDFAILADNWLWGTTASNQP